MTPASFQEQLDNVFKEIWADDGLYGPVVMGIPEAKTAITRLIIESLPERLPTDNISNEANLLGVAHNRVLDTITAVIEGKVSSLSSNQKEETK